MRTLFTVAIVHMRTQMEEGRGDERGARKKDNGVGTRERDNGEETRERDERVCHLISEGGVRCWGKGWAERQR